MPHHGEIVADEEIGQPEPLLQVAHQIEDLRLHRDVERAGRLVADQELRLARQGAGDGDALPLAAGEFVRVLLAVGRRKSDLREQLADPVADVGVSERTMPNARIGSATMSRTRQRGLSDAYGS